MALSSAEALAVEVVVRAAAGLPTPLDDEMELDRDEVHSALTVLFESGAKRPKFGFAPGDVDDVTAKIWARLTGPAPQRPEPEWDDDELQDDDEEVEDVDAGAVRPARLPEFEGRIPVGVVTKLNGASQRISRAIHVDEVGVALVEWECGDVSHGRTKDGLKRRQTLDVLELFELGGAGGRRLLNHMKERYRDGQAVDPLPFGQAADEALITDAIAAGVTDASGVALTPTEAAELGVGGNGGGEPVTVIFDDATRAVWPDDFPKGTTRPTQLGVRMAIPGGNGKIDSVAQLLDFLTGRPLEGVTWADETFDDDVDELVDEGLT